jgi:phosphoribosylformylglycinamidine synthase subunit PurL
VHDHLGGRPPLVDLEAEAALGRVLVQASRDGLAAAAHDLSAGGLGQALVEASLRFGVGARVGLQDVRDRDGVDTTAAVFAESGGRVLVAVAPESADALAALCAEHGVPRLTIGTTGGGALAIDDVELTLDELTSVHTGTLAQHFG